ncbi:MAG: hypothetical protein EXS35_10405 [Pedosphaera sp.]|nr:hypothetical protein [Pedosphaera sp.]
MNGSTPTPTTTRRFTLDGSDALEARLAEICERVAAGVRKTVPAGELEAIVLGGGYGRGQGGVLKSETGDAPYNDLEFYVFVRGNTVLNDRRHRAALTALGEVLSPEAGLHVEFKIISAEKLRGDRVTMFSYDLVAGHRVVFGDEKIFTGCEHHLAAEKIPMHEATRLLLNRCTGLLFAEARLRKLALNPDDVDFIGRNVAKAQLAFGDVALVVFGEYHGSVIERRARLEKLAPAGAPVWLADARARHTAGVQFKLYPYRKPPTGSNLRAKHAEVVAFAEKVWLWLENRRLKQNFASVRDYVLDGGNKCPETSATKNWLINMRTFGWRAILRPAFDRYPRERLLCALPLLLWHASEVGAGDPGLRLRAQLNSNETDWPGLVADYTKLWQRYS